MGPDFFSNKFARVHLFLDRIYEGSETYMDLICNRVVITLTEFAMGA